MYRFIFSASPGRGFLRLRMLAAIRAKFSPVASSVFRKSVGAASAVERSFCVWRISRADSGSDVRCLLAGYSFFEGECDARDVYRRSKARMYHTRAIVPKHRCSVRGYPGGRRLVPADAFGKRFRLTRWPRLPVLPVPFLVRTQAGLGR
jgi:hypothetical protein